MEKFECKICHYIYDPVLGEEELNIMPNTCFSEIRDDFRCPVCCSFPDDFVRITDDDAP